MVEDRGSCESSGAPESWNTPIDASDNEVELLRLRDGFDLVLSRFRRSSDHLFAYDEPSDMVGLGYHLVGGAHFDLGTQHFSTRSLDVWAVSAPAGSRSTFSLPTCFRTVSIRMTPNAAATIMDDGEGQPTALATLLSRVGADVLAEQQDPMDALGAARIEAMLNTPYTGAARRLFQESCALGLLAGQLNAERKPPNPSVIRLADRRRILAARDCLEARLDDPPTTLELAREVGTNDFKLKRDFRQTFGETIFGYVRRRRLERAAGHLEDGLSVQAAAFAAGYECPRCFAGAFRRRFGVLPRDVTRSVLHLAGTPALHG